MLLFDESSIKKVSKSVILNKKQLKTVKKLKKFICSLNIRVTSKNIVKDFSLAFHTALPEMVYFQLVIFLIYIFM